MEACQTEGAAPCEAPGAVKVSVPATSQHSVQTVF